MPVGCKNCNNVGFKGRIALNELLIMNDKLRKFILKEYASQPIRDLAITCGTKSLIVDRLIKVLKGFTKVREVLGGS